MNDPYVYPGTNVLINKFEIQEQSKLDTLEIKITSAKKLMLSEVESSFDYTHLKRIHQHLFGDIYDWAGQERNVRISKGGDLFAIPERISMCLDTVFRQLKKDAPKLSKEIQGGIKSIPKNKCLEVEL